MEIFANDIYDDLKYMPRNKKIAIWGFCQESLDILTKAINVRVEVNFFVDIDENYKGPDFFNKKIITKNQLCTQNDIFVIISKEEYKKNKEWIDKYLNGNYYLVDVGEIDRKIRNVKGNIYIYGAGNAGRRTLQILKERNIEIQGFIDSDNKKIAQQWCNYDIYNKLILDEDDLVIISSMYCSEIYNELVKVFDKNKVFIDYRNSRGGLIPLRYNELNSVWIRYKDYPIEAISVGGYDIFFATLWNDFWNKEIILYGNNEITEQVIEILELLGIRIAYIVEETNKISNLQGYSVKDVYELPYENMEKKFVLVTKVDDYLSVQKKKLLIDEGRILSSLGLKFYGKYRPILSIDYNNKKCIEDKLLNHVQLYEGTIEKYTGFYISGKMDNDKRKIVVLGGSTSDPGTYENLITNWTTYLEKKYEDVVVYSGGIQGYNVVQECLKLLRDIRQLKPALIISYSGVNDANGERDNLHPFIYKNQIKPNIWYGIEESIESSELWIYMERYMQAISSINGSEYISILQPAFCQRKEDELTEQEKLLSVIYGKNDIFMNNYKEFTQQIKERISEFAWMYDLTNAFDGVKETVYRDMCHLTDLGNEIIAEKISNIIDDYYKNKERIW